MICQPARLLHPGQARAGGGVGDDAGGDAHGEAAAAAAAAARHPC